MYLKVSEDGTINPELSTYNDIPSTAVSCIEKNSGYTISLIGYTIKGAIVQPEGNGTLVQPKIDYLSGTQLLVRMLTMNRQVKKCAFGVQIELVVPPSEGQPAPVIKAAPVPVTLKKDPPLGRANELPRSYPPPPTSPPPSSPVPKQFPLPPTSPPPSTTTTIVPKTDKVPPQRVPPPVSNNVQPPPFPVEGKAHTITKSAPPKATAKLFKVRV